MKDIFNSCKDFFLHIPNYVFYTLLFLSLIVLEYYSFHPSPDISIQLHTLTNFVNGNGITETSINENNVIFYQPVSYWPAGLVVFLTPIYLVTKSAIISALILKVISIIFFILFLSKYFNYLNLKTHQKNIICFFFLFSVAPFIHFYTSDLFATVLCLWGFYFNLKYQDSDNRIDLVKCLFLLALSYFVKLSFLPFLFYPALSFILKEREQVFKKLKQLFVIIIFSIVAVIIIYTLNTLLVGRSTQPMGFDAFLGKAHWELLSRFDGFLFTLGNYEDEIYFLINQQMITRLTFNLISILVTVYAYALFLFAFFKKKTFSTNKRLINSFNISLSAGALIIFFLAFLTINNPGQTWKTPSWTYVEETRYYGPVIVIGLINLLIIAMNNKKNTFTHIMVLIMFLLNFYAYKFIIRNGFQGQNFKTYLEAKKTISDSIEFGKGDKIPIVYFDSKTKKSELFHYLQSQGTILVNKTGHEFNNDKENKFTRYFLTKDSVIWPRDSFRYIFNVVRINP